MLPLASLRLGIALIEILEKYSRIAERKAEYKTDYSFYFKLLAMYKSGQLTNEELTKKKELQKTLQSFSS